MYSGTDVGEESARHRVTSVGNLQPARLAEHLADLFLERRRPQVRILGLDLAVRALLGAAARTPAVGERLAVVARLRRITPATAAT
jgi:hypothetical protein